MRLRTGKSGKYLYYACSRNADIGKAACKGLSIPMRQLDELVTSAVCERVLEPSRLMTMVSALAGRNARHQGRLHAELRDLFAKQREINAQIKNLIDVMEKGGLRQCAASRSALPHVKPKPTRLPGSLR